MHSTTKQAFSCPVLPIRPYLALVGLRPQGRIEKLFQLQFSNLVKVLLRENLIKGNEKISKIDQETQKWHCH